MSLIHGRGKLLAERESRCSPRASGCDAGPGGPRTRCRTCRTSRARSNRPKRHSRSGNRSVLRSPDARLQPQVVVPGVAVQVGHDLHRRIPVRPMDGGDVHQDVEVGLGIVAEPAGHLAATARRDDGPVLVPERAALQNRVREAGTASRVDRRAPLPPTRSLPLEGAAPPGDRGSRRRGCRGTRPSHRGRTRGSP